jgi:hypothetical protein
VDSIYPLLLEVLPVQTRLIATLALGLLISVVSFPKSLAAKQVICTTWLSIILYTVWSAAALYNHMAGTAMPSPVLVQHGVLWNSTSKYMVTLLCSRLY